MSVKGRRGSEKSSSCDIIRAGLKIGALVLDLVLILSSYMQSFLQFIVLCVVFETVDSDLGWRTSMFVSVIGLWKNRCSFDDGNGALKHWGAVVASLSARRHVAPTHPTGIEHAYPQLL